MRADDSLREQIRSIASERRDSAAAN